MKDDDDDDDDVCHSQHLNGPKRVGSGKNQGLPKSTYATVGEARTVQ